MEFLCAQYRAEPVARPTVAGLLAHMDSAGVDAAVICPVATRPDQVCSINRWVAGLNEDRLIRFGALHPACPDLDEEIKFLVDHGIHGVKLQPYFQDFELLATQTLRLFERIAGRLIVLLHGGEEIMAVDDIQPTPERLLRLRQTFPDMQLIVAHLGGNQMWDAVEQYLVGQDVYLDLSYVFNKTSDAQIDRIIRGHGPARILFASDFPWQSPTDVLAGLDRLTLDAVTRRMILGENLVRLLRL